MKPEQQRIAIAETCGKTSNGWYCQHCHQDVQPEHVTYQETHDPRAGGCGHTVSGYGLPDYLNDLNAMHEAEPHLGDIDNWLRYDKLLAECATKFTFHATAAQRAEAFLRTLNLWTT